MFPPLPIPVRGRRIRQASGNAFPQRTVEAVTLEDSNKSLGFLERELPQDYTVHDGEHCGVCTYAQAHCYDHNSGEAGLVEKGSDGEPKVLSETQHDGFFPELG